MFITNLSQVQWLRNLPIEVDEKNQIGCMLAAGSYYPETCKPGGDYWQAICDNREVYMFADVQARGYYPSYALKMD